MECLGLEPRGAGSTELWRHPILLASILVKSKLAKTCWLSRLSLRQSSGQSYQGSTIENYNAS